MYCFSKVKTMNVNFCFLQFTCAYKPPRALRARGFPRVGEVSGRVPSGGGGFGSGSLGVGVDSGRVPSSMRRPARESLRIFAKSGTRERIQNVILRQMPKETQGNPRWRENNTFLHRFAACDHLFAFLFWCERPLCARKTTFVCCNRADARARVPCACVRVHTFFDLGVISPASWKSTTKGHVRKII